MPASLQVLILGPGRPYKANIDLLKRLWTLCDAREFSAFGLLFLVNLTGLSLVPYGRNFIAGNDLWLRGSRDFLSG